MHLLFGFSGRIGRLQWWLGQLASLGFIAVAVLLVSATVDFKALNEGSHRANGDIGWSAVFVVIALALLLSWTSFALSVKRFHDRDKSGWWVLINFVPYLGALWLLVECGFLTGTDGSNYYGPPPGEGSLDWTSDIDLAALPKTRVPAQSTPVPIATSRMAQSAPRARPVGPVTFGRRGG